MVDVDVELHRIRPHRDLIGDAAVQAVAHRVDVPVTLAGAPRDVADAELERMRAGDIRERRAVIEHVARAVDEELPRAILPAGGLLEHADHRGVHRADRVANGALEGFLHGAVDEHAIGERDRDVGRDLTLDREVVIRPCFRGEQGAAGSAGHIENRRPVARGLLHVEHAELHLRRGLHGHPHASVVDVRVVRHGLTQVRLIRPDVRVVPVLVVELVGHPFRRGRAPAGQVEPRLAAAQRSAKPRVDVEHVVDAIRSPKARILQPLREVAAAESFGRAVHEQHAVERVAAFARDDVHAHAAARGIGAGARIVDGDFLRRRHVERDL